MEMYRVGEIFPSQRKQQGEPGAKPEITGILGISAGCPVPASLEFPGLAALLVGSDLRTKTAFLGFFLPAENFIYSVVLFFEGVGEFTHNPQSFQEYCFPLFNIWDWLGQGDLTEALLLCWGFLFRSAAARCCSLEY